MLRLSNVFVVCKCFQLSLTKLNRPAYVHRFSSEHETGGSNFYHTRQARIRQFIDFFARLRRSTTRGQRIGETFTSFAYPVRSLWCRRCQEVTAGGGGGGGGKRALNGSYPPWSRDGAPDAYVICDVTTTAAARQQALSISSWSYLSGNSAKKCESPNAERVNTEIFQREIHSRFTRWRWPTNGLLANRALQAKEGLSEVW